MLLLIDEFMFSTVGQSVERWNLKHIPALKVGVNTIRLMSEGCSVTTDMQIISGLTEMACGEGPPRKVVNEVTRLRLRKEVTTQERSLHS